MTFGLIGAGLATADDDGMMSAADFSELSGVAPTDPTAAILTSTASFTYQSGTGSVVSTLDGITLSFDWLYDIGCAAAAAADGGLVVLIECGGFGQSKSQFSAAHKQRLASYRGTTTTRSFLVVAPNTRGRGAVSGTIDYNRDNYDRLDCARAAAAIVEALGVTVFASGEVFDVSGYSTGGYDVQSAMAHLTNHVKDGIVYFPNWSLIEYWQLSAGSRASLTSSIGDLGTSTAAQVDPYTARECAGALGYLLAMPDGPRLWILGDRTEAPLVPIPAPDPLVTLVAPSPAASSRVHVHITETGDANRILHDSGVDGAGAVYAERYWVPAVLDGAAEWSFPIAGKVQVRGWMKSREVVGQADPRDDRYGIEIWTDASAADCKAAATGGALHALELEYDGHFAFDPVTSQNGKIQILSRSNDRRQAFTAGARFTIDLNAAPVITAGTAGLIELGASHVYSTTEAGTVIGGATITAWEDQVGSADFAASGGNEPATATDANGKTAIEFTAANSDRMTVASLLADFRADFTLIGVLAKTNTTANQLALALATTVSGKNARLTFGYGSGQDTADFFDDSNTRAIVNANGLGGHTFSASNAKHFYVLMRKTDLDGVTRLYESFDGLVWSSSEITGTTFTLTTAITVIGAGYATGAGSPYLFFGGRYYALATYARAMSWAEIEAARGNCKTAFTF
jgi:hypothetical protein